MKLRTFLKAGLAFGLNVPFTGLLAQSFPSKPTTLIVPYPAGGPSDFIARKLQPDASAKLGQPIIIENLGGAGGSIGLNRLINSPADGLTFALGTPMELVLAPLALQSIKFKSEDFKLVAQIGTTNIVLAVRPNLDIKNVDELISHARKLNNQQLSYASVGQGSLYHLIGERFSQLAKIPMIHVPYKGVAQIMTDLMGGQIDMAFLPVAGSIPQSAIEGKIKVIGITAKNSHPLYKQFTPLAAIPGFESMDFDLWAGIQVHKNTPDNIAAIIGKAFYTALDNPEIRKTLESTGNVLLPPRTLPELAKIYSNEIERYRSIAKSINLQPQ
jgi:tripartite-type tricarboxylate transporter receptor subunit TctC